MYGFKPYSGAAYAQGPASVYADSVTEATITETDSEAVVATFITVISEALSLADSPAYTALGFITEALTSTDSMLGVGNFAGAISEGLSPIDAPTVTAAFASLISESNTLADSPAGGYNVVITENAGFADSLTGFGRLFMLLLNRLLMPIAQSKLLHIQHLLPRLYLPLRTVQQVYRHMRFLYQKVILLPILKLVGIT